MISPCHSSKWCSVAIPSHECPETLLGACAAVSQSPLWIVQGKEMTKVCPKCGMEIPEETRGCPACGAGAVSRIILTGATGSMSSGVDLIFGRIHAGRICGEDAKYVTERQFTLCKGDDAWILSPDLSAKNATFVNGVAVAGDTALNEGDEISLKGKAAFIKISFS